MENEFYVIQEEYFYEDDNLSAYYPLDNLIFSSSDEAVNYLVNYVKFHGFESIENTSDEEDHSYLVTDERFPEKYHGEGCTKEFQISKLKLFK